VSAPALLHGYPLQTPARGVDAPEGFEPVPLIDPYEAYVGPYFRRRLEDGSTEYAMPMDERHANAFGVVHGGLLMSFADAACGMTAWAAADWRPAVTLSMNVTFQSAAPSATVLRLRPVIARQTRTILFINGEIFAGDVSVAGVVSVWKVVAKG
jgi:uncharacterized protein (TIGR00369 family)